MAPMLQGRLSAYWASLVILSAAIIGGGMAGGLLSDRIIQIALLPLLAVAVVHVRRAQLPTYAIIWLVALLAILAWQLVPVGWQGGVRLVSASPGKALDYAVFALSLAGFATFVSTLGGADQRRLLWAFVLGYFINLTMAAVTLSFVGGRSHFSSPFYEVLQGAFANPNHFASLIYALIPAFALVFVYERRQVILYVLMVLCAIVILLAANARAATAIAVLLSIVSLLVFLSVRSKWPPRRRLLAVLAVAAIAASLAAAAAIWLNPDMFGQDMRTHFFANTWTAIGAHMPWGSGLGTFREVYPRYELQTGIERHYANHAHNDYLELALELGLPGIVMMIAAVSTILVNLLRTPRTLAFGMGALALLLHSSVDYPMRTYAIGLLFAYFCAVVLSDSSAIEER